MRIRLFVAALAAVALAACGSSGPAGPSYKTGKIIVTSPKEGDVFTIGSPVTVAWRCECEGLQAEYVTVNLDVGGSSEVIDKHFLNGSITWPAGVVARGSVTYSPGLYKIWIATESIPENDRFSHVEATGESGTFKLVR